MIFKFSYRWLVGFNFGLYFKQQDFKLIFPWKIMGMREKILAGKVFIYPTDTVYGLGCDAENVDAVEKIRKIKKREKDKPMSVIAPSFDWIKRNLIVDVKMMEYLPGAYTLVLKKKNKDFLKHVSSGDSLGVRIPDCDFTGEIQKSGKPFVTTSVNLSGKKPANSIKDIDKDIICQVDEVIDAGELGGRVSGLVIGGEVVER